MSTDLDKNSPEESGETRSERNAVPGAGRSRSLFTRGNLAIALGIIAGIFLILVIAFTVAHRTGYIDQYVEAQFTAALDEMGVTMEVESFRVGVSPLRLTIEDALFKNKKSGERLVRIETAVLDMSVMDMLALNTVRNLSIDRTEINGLDVWINFDKEGKSNFSGIEILPPKNVVRFQYSSAVVAVRDARIHFGDELRLVSGAAKNVAIFLKPDSDRAPDSAETGFLYDLSAKESTFAYDGEIVKPVDVSSTGQIDDRGVVITRLELKTPLGTTLLSGKVTDWQEFIYDLKIKSTIDLTQSSKIFDFGTAISGVGNFSGTVSGRGESYQIIGEVSSESLAASNVRLKAVKVTGRGEGEGSIYKASGKAIAEMLTFEDFRIDFPILVGNIRGNGTDFRWVGELQAAAAKSPLGTIGSLYLSDASAEYEDNRLRATVGNFKARKFSNESVNLESIQSSNIRVNLYGGEVEALIPRLTASRLNVDGSSMNDVLVESARVTSDGGKTDVAAASIRVGEYNSDGTRVRNIRAGEVKVASRGGVTKVTAGKLETDQVIAGNSKTSGVVASNLNIDVNDRETLVKSGNVRIASVETDSAVLANLNIAGVRLTIRDGTIRGETADFEAGDIGLRGNGELKNVSVRKPVFVLEPSGRYRASLDMSLGSGVVGNIRLGAARASVVADSDSIALNSLTAEVMDGQVDGNARLATSNKGNSEFSARFRGLDLSKLIALQGGRLVPLQGRTDGSADFKFKGTDFRRLTGTLTAEIVAQAGTGDEGLIPVSGKVGVDAVDGLIDVRYASLETEKSNVNADGRVDLNGYDSNLTVALTSSDASEIDRIIRVLDLSPELEQQLDTYEVALQGAFTFDGRITGNLTEPALNGRTSLESLIVRGRDLGTLVASLESSPEAIRVRDGILQARDGGNVSFSIEMPASGSNNISLSASLNDVDLANLMVLVPPKSVPDQLRDINGLTTGTLTLAGIPNEIEGTANLATRNGTVNGQSFENLIAKADFVSDAIRLSSFEAEFDNGRLSASGFYNFASTEFNFDAKATAIPAAKVLAFFPKSDSVPDVEGIIDLSANATGRGDDASSFDVNFTGLGENVSINKSQFGRIDFEGKTENRVLNAEASTNFSGKKQLITARLDFSDERLPFSAETNFDQSPVGPYIEIFRPLEPGAVAIKGQISGQVLIAGNLTSLDSTGKRNFTWENISGSANLSSAGLLFDETPLTATGPVIVKFNSSEVVFENAKFSGGGSNLVITGTKALTDTGINNLEIAGKVDLAIVRAFSRNALKNIFVNGVVDVSVRLSGVNRTARLNGTAILERGSAATFVGSNRITFERLNGRIRFTTNQVQIEQVTAYLGGGKITASGGALLNDNLSLDRIRLEIRGTNVTVPLPDNFLTTGNANIEINGRRVEGIFASFVSGTVIARRSVYTEDIDLADLISGRRDANLAQSSDSDTSGDVSFSAPQLDIRVIGRESLVVRNNLADLTASADLRLTGDTETPRLSGRITANSGTIFFRDDRYELQRGVLTFPPNSTIDPTVNIQAETDIKGYQIFINLSGDLSDSDSLTAVVTSNPSLPQADVISLITTGSLSNTEEGIPTLAQGGLNTAAKVLTDEIINRPIARATDKLFGINRFELDPIVSGQQGNPTARLTVGRQINRNLLATYSTNISEDQNQVLALEYRVSNRLSFVAAYEQRSLTNVTRNRNKFSFEIRLRKRF